MKCHRSVTVGETENRPLSLPKTEVKNRVFSWCIHNFGNICLIACIAITCAVLVQTMMLRLVNIYRDAPVQMLNSKISAGPAKGLYTTADHQVAYNVVYSAIRKYCQSSNLNEPHRFDNSLEQDSSSVANIFITKLLPWGYMCTDLRCGAPTTWRTPFNSKRLEPYYQMNPGRYPDMILVLNEQFGSYITCGDVESDTAPNENETGGYLLEYINSHDYETIEVPCGTLYNRETGDGSPGRQGTGDRGRFSVSLIRPWERFFCLMSH